MSEAFRMPGALAITADQAPKTPSRCYIGPAGTEPFPYMPRRFRQWAVRWSNDVGSGSYFCTSRKAAEQEMGRFLRRIPGGHARLDDVRDRSAN